MISTLVFDLDGTLLDTLESIALAFNRSLKTLGMPEHPIESYRKFVGQGVYNCAEQCLPGDLNSPKLINQLVEIERADYAKSWRDNTAPYPGIHELLHGATEKGYSLAVLSNKDENFARQCVEYFFPDYPWQAIVGFSADIPHKPDPKGARHVAKQLNEKPKNMLMIGDTNIDIATARACNMPSVGVLWGFRDYEELHAAGAEYIIDRPDQLLDLLN